MTKRVVHKNIHFSSITQQESPDAVYSVMFASPSIHLGPFSVAPSPHFLPGCRGDRVCERHFFPEAPLYLSLSCGFVQPALMADSMVWKTQGGKAAQRNSALCRWKPEQRRPVLNPRINATQKGISCFSVSYGSLKWCLSFSAAPEPPQTICCGLVQSQLVGCVKRGRTEQLATVGEKSTATLK